MLLLVTHTLTCSPLLASSSSMAFWGLVAWTVRVMVPRGLLTSFSTTSPWAPTAVVKLSSSFSPVTMVSPMPVMNTSSTRTVQSLASYFMLDSSYS